MRRELEIPYGSRGVKLEEPAKSRINVSRCPLIANEVVYAFKQEAHEGGEMTSNLEMQSVKPQNILTALLTSF